MRLTILSGLLLLASFERAVGYPEGDIEPRQIAELAEHLLLEKSFSKLEEIASEYRATNRRVKGGNSALYHFYPGLGYVGRSEVFESKTTPERKLVLLEEWRKQYPKSPTASLALALYWERAGWDVRGGGYASGVTPAQWETFHRYLSKARQLLAEVDQKKDPFAYWLQAVIGRESSAPREEMDSLYQQAVTVFPDFFHYYSERGVLLQERWQGKPEELKEFVASLSKFPGGEDGDIAYTYIALQALVKEPNDVFGRLGFDWQRIHAGYKVRKQRYSLRIRDLNAWLFLAALSGHRAEGKVILDELGNQWDKDIWGTEEMFKNVVRYIGGLTMEK